MRKASSFPKMQAACEYKHSTKRHSGLESLPPHGLRVSCFATNCCSRRLHISCRSPVTFANTLWIPSSISNGAICLCLGNRIKVFMSSQDKSDFELKNKQETFSSWQLSSSFIPNSLKSLQCSAYTFRLVYKLCSSFCHQHRQDYQNFLEN